MYIFRRAAARAVSAPRQLRASPRVTSFHSSIPALSRSFHQSRIWRAEEQKKEAENTSTAQDAVAESSGTTSEPLGQSESVSESASETTTTASSSTTPSAQGEHESKPVLEQASEIAEKAKETVSDAAAKAAQAVGEFTQQPKEKAQDAAVYASEQASEGASKVSEQVSETASKVSGQASETASKVNEQASEATSQISQQAQSAAAQATRAGRNTVASTRDTFDNREVPAPSKILYVGNLFFEVTAPQLEAEFAKFGEVTNSRVVTDDRGLSKGFAYIEFANQQQADAASEALNQKVFQGRRMSVQYHRRRDATVHGNRRDPRKDTVPSKTLFIGNMSYQMSDRDLNDLFRSIKNVLDVRVAIDRRSGQPRGFAHADFTDVESAVTAKAALENKSVYGRQLKVDYSGQAKEDGDRPERRERSNTADRLERRKPRAPREPRDDDPYPRY